jgi:hypothetical protein
MSLKKYGNILLDQSFRLAYGQYDFAPYFRSADSDCFEDSEDTEPDKGDESPGLSAKIGVININDNCVAAVGLDDRVEGLASTAENEGGSSSGKN